MSEPVIGKSVDNAIRVALNGLAARQRVVGNNLANVDTPGYKTSGIRFEEQLQEAVARGQSQSTLTLVSLNPRHMAVESRNVEDVQPQLTKQTGTSDRVDGNNVDIDEEMVQLAETVVTYNALVQLAASRISLARYAVNEGRR